MLVVGRNIKMTKNNHALFKKDVLGEVEQGKLLSNVTYQNVDESISNAGKVKSLADTINLLAPIDRPSRLPLKRMGGFFLIITGCIMVGIYSYGQSNIMAMQHKINIIRVESELLRPTEQKMRAVSERQQVIQTKNNILVSLTNERKSWHAVLTHLGVVITGNVWLHEVGITENSLLRIKGVAENYPEIAAFIKRVEQDDFFLEPKLVGTETASLAEHTTFEIIVKVKGM